MTYAATSFCGKRYCVGSLAGLFLFFAVSLQLAAAPLPSALRVLKPIDFTIITNAPGAFTFESAVVRPPASWDELVPSWNAASNTVVRFSVQPVRPGLESRWYPFGVWTTGNGRSSTNGVKDGIAEVDTDILRLREPADGVRVRIELTGDRAAFYQVALAFTRRGQPTLLREPHRAAWGHSLGVPVYSQAEFPEGVDKWCSPTSTAMLLGFWSEELRRPELAVSVPDTAAAVFDAGWNGTGNWPFNVAFAGTLPEVRSCISRFNDLTDLERWLEAGLPAAASVSYALLKGGENVIKGDGHLVVVRGFTGEGDVLINDPGVRRSRVQRSIPRKHFDRAWEHSRRTVYLVWPAQRVLPAGECFP